MTRQELAAEMNVTLADLDGFVAALSVWAAKGYTFEECVERHMAQMMRLASNACELVRDGNLRQMAVGWFYPQGAAR